MDVLSSAIAAFWYSIEQVLNYIETHHWIFAFLAGGYVFYLHDKAVHARFDALEKRIDEIKSGSPSNSEKHRPSVLRDFDDSFRSDPRSIAPSRSDFPCRAPSAGVGATTRLSRL